MTDVLPEAPPGTEAPPPLAGYTVAVTAARRREELGALLARHLVAERGVRHLLLASRRGPLAAERGDGGAAQPEGRTERLRPPGGPRAGVHRGARRRPR